MLLSTLTPDSLELEYNVGERGSTKWTETELGWGFKLKSRKER